MIKSGVELKNALGLFCIQFHEDPTDMLLPEDWKDLEKLQSFFLWFYDATLSTKFRGATIARVLLTVDFLLEQFEDGKRKYQDDIFMGPCCNSGWKKLDKYYSLTERSPVYIAALVLCPQWKWNILIITSLRIGFLRRKLKCKSFRRASIRVQQFQFHRQYW
jgi:hypothetical protein